MKLKNHQIATIFCLILTGVVGCKNKTLGNSTVKDDGTEFASLVSATIADDCFKTPGTQLGEHVTRYDSCTAVLRIGAQNTKFTFYSASPHDVDAIGYTWQCEPVDFPSQPLPANCTISFSGPLIRKTFGDAVASLRCSATRCVPYGDRPRPVQTASLLSATIADDCSKTPGTELYLGFTRYDSCTAVLRIGAQSTKFTFYSGSSDQVNAIDNRCKSVDFPSKALPEKCTISFSGPLIRKTFGDAVGSLHCSATGCVSNGDGQPVQK